MGCNISKRGNRVKIRVPGCRLLRWIIQVENPVGDWGRLCCCPLSPAFVVLDGRNLASYC